jgi:hypothetical protein
MLFVGRSALVMVYMAHKWCSCLLALTRRIAARPDPLPTPFSYLL